MHVSSVANLINATKKEGAISLPCRARAVIKKGNLIFEQDVRRSPKKAEKYDMPLHHGVNFIIGTNFAVSVTPSHADTCETIQGYEKYAEAMLYCSKDSTLSVRNRCDGDAVLDGGMHKKLKKLMCDKKVEPADRDVLPIIYCDGEIIYAPLCAVADQYKAQKNKEIIKISIHKKHGED